jgi:dTDP-4-dehydrorhamnose 3,5-epimerase
MIDGVKVIPLKRIPDERGMIAHMLRSDDPHFDGFGEIYFSFVYPGVVKGWHLHKEMILNYAVPVGTIKLVLFDDRAASPTKGELMELYLGETNYALVRIPALVWNGFKGVGTQQAVVANCSSIAHRANEIERMDPHKNHIPYDWERKDR